MSFSVGTASSNWVSIGQCVLGRHIFEVTSPGEFGILVFDGLLPLAVCFYLVRTWVRWFQGDSRNVKRQWRDSITVFGFAASNIAVLIIITIMFYGLLGRGLQPQSSTSVWASIIVLATALAGLICAFVGTGSLGIQTAICSCSCLLVLLLHGWAS
jgi:hypothetical protein